jgi:hypothetical protein
MRLREHEGIIPGRNDILYCRPDAITVEEGYNVRDLTTPEARAELDELKAQVKEHGVITPLKIRFSGQQIILVEGHRRRTVALELIAEYQASGGSEGRNIEALPIFPEPPGTTVEERDAGLFISNTGTRLKPLEFANLIYRMHTVRGMPLEAVASQLGISMPVLKNHLAMRGMSEPIKEHVRQGDISATLAKNIAKGVDPKVAEEMIKANLEENKRIKGKKKSHKVTAKTLKRDKADKLPVPERAQRQHEIREDTADEQKPKAGAVAASAEPTSPTAMATPSEPLPPVSGNGNDGASISEERGQDIVRVVPSDPERRPFPHTVGGAIKELLAALKPFADLCSDTDASEKADDDIVEVLFADIKRAWSVYTAATGGIADAEAA